MNASKAVDSSRGRPGRLSRIDLQHLRAELSCPPFRFGLGRAQWSGKLLGEHLLRRYGVVLGPRQCRRILRSSEVRSAKRTKPLARASGSPRHDPAVTASSQRAPHISDRASKETALRRIKRICSSGLPLFPLARTLFELMNDAIPHSENRVLLADDGSHPERYVTSSNELAQWAPIHKRFYVDSPPEVSGTVPVQRILSGKLVWRHEDFALPHFYRSAGYNECMRHIGFHHALMINLRDHAGMSGNYPLWRSADMKPFTAEDTAFAQAAAPYIAHALSVASRIAARSEQSGEFVPLQDWGEGVLIVDRAGRVMGADTAARAIFHQLSLFEDGLAALEERRRFESAIAYIQHTLRSAFDGEPDPFANPRSPAARLYCHRIGLVLKLRGVGVDGEGGSSQTVVLIEAGELAEHRRRRLMYRHGLTPRLMELVDFIADGLSVPEIAARTGLSKFTVRDYLHRLQDRLQLSDTPALRRFALEIAAH